MALRFRIGSIPVQVSLFFFLTALMLGSMGARSSPAEAGMWVVVMFCSVLLHELGHAIAGKRFGLSPVISLHGMGGTTAWSEASLRQRLGHGPQMLISFAGPLMGFIVGGITLLIGHYHGMPTTEAGLELRSTILYTNIGWSIFNLVPILPLDGGHLMSHFVGLVTRDRAPRVPHFISIAIALVLGALALYIQWFWIVLLCGLYVHQNVQALRAKSQPAEAAGPHDDNPRFDELAAGFKAIDEGNGHEAIRIAESLLATSRIVEVRLAAVRLLARGRLLEGQWGILMQLLEAARFDLGPTELAQFEQAARELERPDEAAQIRTWLDNFNAAPAAPFRA